MLDADERLHANREKIYRQTRVARIMLWLVFVLLFAVVALDIASALRFIPGNSNLTSTANLVLVGAAALAIMMVWMAFRARRLTATQGNLEEARAIANELRETLPEILAMRRLDELLSQVRAEDSRAGDLWRGFVVNMLFTVIGTVLGIVLTIVAQSAGWIPR
jgi:ABC-type multidrug transport system fused ATPase/permease subunit